MLRSCDQKISLLSLSAISKADTLYSMLWQIMNMVKLFGKPIRVNKASQDRKNVDVGANLFIGNLAPEVDEKTLYDTFSAFGGITQPPKVMYDPETGTPKGFGFVSYDSFEAADYAIECMNGSYLGGRQIVVQYAYKKVRRIVALMWTGPADSRCCYI